MGLNDTKVSKWKVLMYLADSKYQDVVYSQTKKRAFIIVWRSWIKVTIKNLHSPIGKLIWYAEMFFFGSHCEQDYKISKLAGRKVHA